jgi:uncharacterized protein
MLEHRGSWPLPFQQFVLKVHSRCNLACDYCYVYEMADQTWRSRPRVMAPRTVAKAAARIAEHALAHDLPRVRVVFHGGEPLLVGPERLDRMATTLRAAMPAGVTMDLGIQTNAVLLDEDSLPVLRRHGIGIGVSLDGSRGDHDRHRRYANGEGSHTDVIRGLESLRQEPFRSLFAGILCTIDLGNDPVGTYEALLEFSPPAVDFLLPHGNWTQRPPGRPDDDSAPYGDWLIQVFDRWYDAPRHETSVRLFDNIVLMLLGGQSESELIGLTPSRLITVDTDGSLEQVDTLKSSFHGAAATGLNVFDHPLDSALAHPAVVARQIGLAALSDTCLPCSVRDVCGGGAYPHRYRAGSGFRNPSVYCRDLQRLIEHARRRIVPDLGDLLAWPL